MTSTFDAHVPLFLRLVESSLRGGYNIVQSFSLAADESALPAAAGDQLRQVVADIKGGAALPQALAAWLKRSPGPDLDLVIATLRVQLETGGNLADKFNLLGQILQQRSLPTGA
ncbi:MAG TPA: type II secretion system F family protein [Herpetosiphonaceae bacterium]|nr:type II secretion system F family protein [Herpetosiphonaceae bacterium]